MDSLTFLTSCDRPCLSKVRKKNKPRKTESAGREEPPPPLWPSGTHLHDVLQVLLRVRLLRHELGSLEVCLDEHVAVARTVPVGAGDLHQAVAEQQHQQEQAPGVGRRDPDGLELVPGPRHSFGLRRKGKIAADA